MAIKTFTTGEVLTASDTNTYLANSGLVYITTATATSGTSLSIDNCFTTTYDSYVIYFTGVPASGAYGVDMRFRASGTDTTTGYYFGVSVIIVNGGTPSQDWGNNAGLFPLYAIADTSGRCTSVVQIVNPKLAQYTGVSAQSTDTRGSNSYGAINMSGQLKNNTQYDGVSFLFGGGGGTIGFMQARIYGVRQA